MRDRARGKSTAIGRAPWRADARSCRAPAFRARLGQCACGAILLDALLQRLAARQSLRELTGRFSWSRAEALFSALSSAVPPMPLGGPLLFWVMLYRAPPPAWW